MLDRKLWKCIEKESGTLQNEVWQSVKKYSPAHCASLSLIGCSCVGHYNLCHFVSSWRDTEHEEMLRISFACGY